MFKDMPVKKIHSLKFCRACGDHTKLSKGLCRLCSPADMTHTRTGPEVSPQKLGYAKHPRRCNMCDERRDAGDFVGEMCGPCHRTK